MNRHSVTINQRIDTFSFDVSEKPDLVNVDADKTLLAAITDRKTTEQYVFQYKNAPLYLDRHNAIEHFVNNQAANDRAEKQLISAINDEYWGLRKKAIQAIERNDDNEKRIIALISDRAKHDNRSDVRAAAINKLGSFALDSLAYMFKRGLGDSSYQVVAASLEALNQVAPDEAEEEAAKREDVANRNIVSAVAGIYAANETPGKMAYFDRQISKLSGVTKYMLINQYKKYITTLPMTKVEDALPGLKKVAMENDAWFIRYIAAQSIMNAEDKFSKKKKKLEDELAKLEEKENTGQGKIEKLKVDIDQIEEFLDKIEQIKSELKAQESNERLKQLY